MEANVVDHSSMWSLVSNASLVVQLVMLILLAASVTSWVMISRRSTMLRAGRERYLDELDRRGEPRRRDVAPEIARGRIAPLLLRRPSRHRIGRRGRGGRVE